jgi:hypothetical protein
LRIVFEPEFDIVPRVFSTFKIVKEKTLGTRLLLGLKLGPRVLAV